MKRIRAPSEIVVRVLVFVFLLFGILTALRMLVGGGEDTWICVDGEWVKHGVPSAPKPESGCGDQRGAVQRESPPSVGQGAIEERLEILKNNLHAPDSGTEAKELFPDLSPVYVDDGHDNPQIPREILPFTYYYSQEANITVSICNIDQTVFVCPGKLERLIQPQDYNRCRVTEEYLQIEP